MNRKPSVSFLIPAYNDQTTIRTAVEEAKRVGERYCSSFELLVINDASRDNTAVALQKLQSEIPKLSVLFHAHNIGYGGTIRELYYAGACEWLFTLPGDYQIGAMELIHMLPHTKNADIVLGWRRERHDPPGRLRQSAIYNWLLARLFGLSFHDINSVKLIRKSVMDRVSLKTTSAFVDAELMIRARDSGCILTEVPILHRERMGDGASGGTWWTILPVIRDMVLFYMKARNTKKSSS